MKQALGPERSAQLFQAIHGYKKTDDYDSLVATVVSLFTERDENFHLLISRFCLSPPQISWLLHAGDLTKVLCVVCFQGFGVFVRPHHKKQYKEMLDALIGQPVSCPAVSEEQPSAGQDPSVMLHVSLINLSNWFLVCCSSMSSQLHTGDDVSV